MGSGEAPDQGGDVLDRIQPGGNACDDASVVGVQPHRAEEGGPIHGRSTIKNFGVPEHIAQVDADRLQFPLTLRRWREGDSFVPFGMTGRKKVSDFLIDAKVSMAEKQRQFVLLSGGEIVWLVGRRIDDRYRLTPDTENVLRITKEIV